MLYLGSSATTLINGTNCVNGAVRAVNLTTGTPKWESCAPGIIRAGLTFADGLVVDAADWTNNLGATVEVRDAATGVVLRSIAVNQTVNGEPVIFDGRLFFGSGNWTLCGNTSYDPHCPRGYVYAYGVPLNANPSVPDLLPISQCQSSYSVQFNTDAQGGMPFYAYNWTFGDGTWAQGPGPIHTYAFQGNYTVDVVGEDSAAEENSASMNVVATYQSPPARVIVGCSMSTAICPQMRCTGPAPFARSFFVNYYKSVGPVTIQWSFGDGSISTQQDPTHTYSKSGLYSVSLSITDSEGNVGSWSMEVWA